MSRFAKMTLPLLVTAAVGLLAAFASAAESYQYALVLVLIWATVGGSWNIISGYGGQMAFGHAVFFGIGAYIPTLLMVSWHLTPMLGVFPAIVTATIAALLIGWPTFRLSGVYFSLATLAFPLALIPILSFAHLHEVSMPFMHESADWYLQFENPRQYTFTGLALLIVSLLVVACIERSRLGAALLAIRDDEWAAEASGIDAHRTKMIAFVISAAIAAAAGTLYATLLLVVTPDSVFGLSVTVKSLMVSLVGGLATVWGPLIGAIILVPMSQYLLAQYGGVYPGIDNVVLGLFLIVIIIWAPEGLYWKIRDLLAKRKRICVSETAGEPSHERVAMLPLPPAGPSPSPSIAPILTVSGLSKAFGGVGAVENVTFELAAGEILGVIGPNGAGKTTTMNLVNGFIRPDSGIVRFAGELCTGQPPWLMRRRGFGRTFQMPRVLARRTVAQNVEIGAFHLSPDIDVARTMTRNALRRVDLDHRVDDLPAALSTAEIRKLELARAIVGGPRVLLLDEPMAGLVASDIHELSALVRSLRDQGMSIIIIEHTMSAMVALVDRFIVFDQGQLLTAGAPASVTRDPKVIEAYLGAGWA